MLKSPAMSEALKPIHRLEAEAAKENEIAQQAYAAGLDAYKLRRDVSKALAREKLKSNKDAEIDFDCNAEPKEPTPVRYRTNDSTYEGLGELLINNPNGILVERDELTSLLKQLDRDEQAVARGFYLSGWSGTQPYTFDRIIRGHRHIEAVCISVLGNTQPARIIEYIRAANLGGAGGDGLIQRFGVLVWPDAPARVARRRRISERHGTRESLASVRALGKARYRCRVEARGGERAVRQTSILALRRSGARRFP